VYCQGCPGHRLYCGTKMGRAGALPVPNSKPARSRPPDAKAAVATPAFGVRFMCIMCGCYD